MCGLTPTSPKNIPRNTQGPKNSAGLRCRVSEEDALITLGRMQSRFRWPIDSTLLEWQLDLLQAFTKAVTVFLAEMVVWEAGMLGLTVWFSD